MSTENGLHLVPSYRAESTVATLTGTLTTASYPELRDGVLKVATDAPESVVADIRGLEVGDHLLLGVFAVIAARIGDWPGLPFAVVTDHADHVARLVARAVSVHADVGAAERARIRPARRRAIQLLASSPGASAAARAFVERTCSLWGVREHIEDALLVATELVENAVVHTDSRPRLRLELRPGTLTVSVADDDPRQAVLLERPAERGLGLRMVAHTAHVWGCSRSWAGGKVVWAVLTPSRRRRRVTGERADGHDAGEHGPVSRHPADG
ncbi:ATP-binding protein [Amycolatopsis sp. FBCC-B4732]|uniref:ATP-binding protein n=1 Tax=Amycolatopsis sp. FBCC-B4732 TaxID=3079339 RepID=UPI001FF3BD86|nr:ATP-binding protein [Amycolatopsis sp. FBCC-B4732]UOX85870.1 ATP-binding protein [Amycolatopsis sp. FBCC-B4732]